MDEQDAFRVKKICISSKISTELKKQIKLYWEKRGFNSESDFFRHIIRKELEDERKDT